MGGGNRAEQQSQALAQTQADTARKESEVGQEYLDFAKQRMGYADTLQKPGVDFWKSISTGNSGSTIAAASPLLGQIAQQTKQAEGNIRNTVPAGAGRDYALAQNEIQRGQANASTINSTFQNALQQLTQLGSAQQGVSLQQTGAGISGISGAQAGFGNAQGAYSNIMQAESQRKASTMGAVGSIFGAAGQAAGGYFSKH